MEISSTIRHKPNWEKKVFSEEIVKKWEEELKDFKIFHDRLITPKIFKYIIEELRWFATQKSNNNNIGISPVDGVYEVTDHIPDDLRLYLDEDLQYYEKYQDWHPGSNNMVLNLVHPSMYCYINGISETMGWNVGVKNIDKNPKVETVNNNKSNKLIKKSYSRSDTYQWLPTDVHIDKSGRAKFLSYINNIHPDQTRLYETLEKILERFIPLFNNVLTEYAYPRKPTISYDVEWYESLAEWVKNNTDTVVNSDNDDDYESEYWDEYYDRRLPIIPDFDQVFDQNKFDYLLTKAINLNNRHLQVIVKAANIILTPEKPEYAGGTWHIEGMENESIVATGLYYYKIENIADSTLHFRTHIHDPELEQSDFTGAEYVYGLSNDTKCLNMDLGHVDCLEGKCIAFPNIYQHYVAPFKLIDKTRPGIRKILAFFLVDPTKKVISTTDIRPQQEEWQCKKLTDVLGPITSSVGEPLFTQHIIDTISRYSCNYLTRKEAEEHRLKLIEERKYFIDQNTHKVFERQMNLCEH
jgi:hypothetical protein